MSTEHRPLPMAVALSWDGDGAPRVTAKGRGEIAERILALAREHKVPLREDRALVAVLSKVDLETQIPPALYKAVAEVIAFAYALQGRALQRRPAAARAPQGAAFPARSKADAAAD